MNIIVSPASALEWSRAVARCLSLDVGVSACWWYQTFRCVTDQFRAVHLDQGFAQHGPVERVVVA